MFYLVQRGFIYSKSSISRISPKFSAKRFFSEIFYSPLWEFLSPQTPTPTKSLKGFVFKLTFTVLSLYTLNRALTKALTMAKTRNTATPASSSKKRPRPSKPDRVIIDTTVEEHKSSNHSAEEIISSDDDSTVVLVKKSRLSIKFINADYEARYHEFNLANRKVIYGKLLWVLNLRSVVWLRYLLSLIHI